MSIPPEQSHLPGGVVFVGGAWNSGSTLLGLMLGAHPSMFFAGEVRECGPACEVWTDDLRGMSGVDLYGIDWIERQVTAGHGTVPLNLVVLTRDGRAVVNSRIRGKPATAEHQARKWIARMRATEELASRWPGSVHRVRYEELASRPGATMRTLASFLGLAFDPVMLEPWSSEQHPLGGNEGPLSLLTRDRAGLIELSDSRREWYRAQPPTILLDQRWKHEMSAEALTAFEAVAGEFNRTYAWEDAAS